jgi:hypothetical protein
MNAIFTGRKRSGKTTLAFHMAMERGGGILVYDPKREWRNWPATTSDVNQIEVFAKEKHEVIVFHPVGDKDEAIEPLIDFITKLHNVAMANDWDKQGLHFTLIVDEAVNVSTAHWINEKLLALVAENRPEILDIYLTFQSPKDANNLLKSRVSDWFVFSTSLPSDLDYLRKEVGVPEYDLYDIQRLDEHEYAHFFFDGGTPKVEYYNEPEEWFIDLEFTKENEEKLEDKTMARDKDSMADLFEEFLDWLDDSGHDVRRRENDDDRERDSGRNRDRNRERDDRDRNRGRRSSSRFEVFRRAS